MECPFELPVKIKDGGPGDRELISKLNQSICRIWCKADADYITQAINSRDALLDACKELVADRDILQQDEGIFACQCLAKAPDDITEPPLCCYCLGKESIAQAER